MNNEELQILTETLSTTFFKKPFLHKATFNPRLRTTGGRYLLKSHNIEINKKYYDEHGLKELEGIIKHELCHYHLHIEGRGYKHRDKDFRNLMLATGSPRHCSPLQSEKQRKQTSVRVYGCTRCKVQFNRQRRVNTSRYVCGLCNGKLEEIVSIQTTNINK